MARKHYDVPNTDNLTDGGCVDILCDWKEKEKEAKFYTGFYSDLVKNRLDQADSYTVKGEKFIAELKTFDTTRFDLDALKEAAGKGDASALDVMNRFYKTSPVTQLRTKELAQPTVMEAPPLRSPTELLKRPKETA